MILLIYHYLIFQERAKDFRGWIKIYGDVNAYSITADGGEDIVVSRVDEVEGDGVKGALALVESVADSVLPLLRRRQRTYCRLAAQTGLRHRLPTPPYFPFAIYVARSSQFLLSARDPLPS